MSNPPYPLEIIPSNLYPRLLCLEEIIKRNGHFVVCRRIDKPVKDYIVRLAGGRKELKLDALGEHIVKMSMNLLGGNFDESHLPFNPTENGKKRWSGKEIDIKDYSSTYDFLKAAFPLYYDSKEIHRRVYPASLTFSPKDGNKYKALRDNVTALCLEAFRGVETTVDIPIMLFVSHEPTNLNYWHVQLDMKPSLEDDSKTFKNDNSYRKDIYTQIVSDVLCKKFIESVDQSFQ